MDRGAYAVLCVFGWLVVCVCVCCVCVCVCVCCVYACVHAYVCVQYKLVVHFAQFTCTYV